MSSSGTSGTVDHARESPVQHAKAVNKPIARRAWVQKRSCGRRSMSTASAMNAIAPADVNAPGK